MGAAHHAFFGAIGQFDARSVLICDLFDDGQTQAGATRFGGDIGLESALQDVGRKLGIFIRRGLREADAEKKRSYIEKYIPHIGIALQEILAISDKERDKVCDTLKDTLERSRS